MIFFIGDACAVARVYLPDIGKANMVAIYRYPDSRFLTPEIAYVEVASVLISAHREGLIDTLQYRHLRASFVRDLRCKKIAPVRLASRHYELGVALLDKHKRQQGKLGLGGADSLYLSLAVDLKRQLPSKEDRVILVTSDKSLYNSALDEPGIEAFHFWTCDMGCRCGSKVIPVKGKPKVPNSCPSCGQTCPECRYDLCPSNYKVHF